MKRLLFLCHGAGNGGAERVITTLAGSFAELNYSVKLVTTNESNNDYVLNRKIKHEMIISNKRTSFLRSIDRILQLRNSIKSFKPECIISFSSISNMQAIVANIGLKSKLIISERTDPSRYPVSKIGKGLRKILYLLSERIVFQTNEAKAYFPKKIQDRSLIIPNPIRNDLPDPSTEKRENRIVGIGSLSEQKNWGIALEACKIFFNVHPEYKFYIYGEGPLRNNLQKEINRNECLRNRVILYGFSSDVIERIVNARMYISSSDYEGISNAMLEALAVGVPAICTDCPVGGSRENIKNGINGLLVPVRNSKALSTAMIRLAEDEDLCIRISKNSIKIREQLKLEQIVDLWENEVRRICKE